MNSKIHDNNEQGDRHPDVASLLGKLPPGEAERLREVWELAGNQEPGKAPTPEEVEQVLGRFEASLVGADRHALNGSPVRQAARQVRRTDRGSRMRTTAPRVPKWVGWAAAAVLLLGGLGLYWLSRPITQVVPPGERVALTLPDGSSVELNSGSRLRYARRFGNIRRVHLSGEAFFDVAEGERPFVVETYNAQIRVLGTRFGVRAWPGGPEEGTIVALETGRVILAPAAYPDRAVEMEAGETRRVNAGTTGVDLSHLPGVSVDDATAWRRGDLVYKDQLLGVVLRDMERRYAVDIQLQPVRLQRKRLNLALRQPAGAEAVIHDLALALGLKYRETSTGYELFQDTGPLLNP